MRTDLAIENPFFEGYEKEKKKICEKIIFDIETEEMSQKIGKPKGKYVTLQFDNLMSIENYSEIETEIIDSLNILLPEKRESILVVGIGNSDITSDSIGPLVAKKILATRHIKGKFAEQIGLSGIKGVSVIAPDVLGNTGIELIEIINGLSEKIKPDAIIVADALAAGSIKRLFTTIQLCNTGIFPGSGVKNRRKEISEKTVGVPVIAIGVPTVVDALSLSYELSGKEAVFDTDLIVTPKDADLLCHRISEIISKALNIFDGIINGSIYKQLMQLNNKETNNPIKK